MSQTALDFLRATKTSEAMDDDLRRALYVSHMLSDGTPIEIALADALADGQTVVVTGSAGGGKTMLIDAVVRCLEARSVSLAYPGQDALDDSVVVIRDLTAIVGDRASALRAFDSSGAPMIIGANEGVLQSLSELPFIAAALSALRLMQRGLEQPFDEDAPVVVDMAAIDPVADALSRLLAHPLLHDAVALHEQSVHDEDLDLCVRLRALTLLRDPDRVENLAKLIRTSLGPGEVLFRDLWDFIADVLIGGECDRDDDTSAWFWRVAYGSTAISERIRSQLRPEHVSLPSVAHALFDGNWVEAELQLPEIAEMLRPVHRAADCEENLALHLMKWLKVQIAMLAIFRGRNIFPGGLVTSLVSEVRDQSSVQVLLKATNAYFRRRRYRPTDSATLELWVEMAVARRTDRQRMLLALGTVPSSRFAIRRSRVIGNLQGVADLGSTYLLSTSGAMGPSLVLDVGLLTALTRGRPIGTRDRSVDDQDFALRRFFFELASAGLIEEVDRLSTLYGGNERAPRTEKWVVDPAQGTMLREGV